MCATAMHSTVRPLEQKSAKFMNMRLAEAFSFLSCRSTGSVASGVQTLYPIIVIIERPAKCYHPRRRQSTNWLKFTYLYCVSLFSVCVIAKEGFIRLPTQSGKHLQSRRLAEPVRKSRPHNADDHFILINPPPEFQSREQVSSRGITKTGCGEDMSNITDSAPIFANGFRRDIRQ